MPMPRRSSPLRSRPVVARIPALGVTTVVTLALFVLAGCTSAAATPSGSPAADASAAPSPAASAMAASPSPADASPSPSPKVTQTDTSWGPIWDAVPASFPVPTGAEPVSVNEAVSTSWSIQGTDAASVAQEMQTALEAAGYSTAASSGPLENGARIIDSVGASSACAVQTRVTPLGDTVSVTVMFGAACPFR